MSENTQYAEMKKEDVSACRVLNQAAVGTTAAFVGGAVAAVAGAGFLKCCGAAVLVGLAGCAAADVYTKVQLQKGGAPGVSRVWVPFC